MKNICEKSSFNEAFIKFITSHIFLVIFEFTRKLTGIIEKC
jgi:hypothetical protein